MYGQYSRAVFNQEQVMMALTLVETRHTSSISNLNTHIKGQFQFLQSGLLYCMKLKQKYLSVVGLRIGDIPLFDRIPAWTGPRVLYLKHQQMHLLQFSNFPRKARLESLRFFHSQGLQKNLFQLQTRSPDQTNWNQTQISVLKFFLERCALAQSPKFCEGRCQCSCGASRYSAVVPKFSCC